MDYAGASNEELAGWARQGDEAALAELVERSWPLLRSELMKGVGLEGRQPAREAVLRAARECDRKGERFLRVLSIEAERPEWEREAADRNRRWEALRKADTRTPEELFAAWAATWEARSHFEENWVRFNGEKLLSYAGQTVAWAPDGASIVDADADRLVLYERLLRNGKDASVLVFEYIEPPMTVVRHS